MRSVLARKVSLLACAIVLARADLALGQQALLRGESVVVFPAAASVVGAFGAIFRTRVTIMNPNPTTLAVGARLATPDQAAFADRRTIGLLPFQTVAYDDFLAEVFGYTGGAAIQLDGVGLFASAEVYVDVPAGRYSTSLPAFTLASPKLYSTRASSSLFGVVTGLRNDGQAFRSNVGCANLTPYAATVSIRDPAKRGDSTDQAFSMPPTSWTQAPLALLGDRIALTFQVFLTIRDTDPDFNPNNLGVYCYGVTVNNRSNDGTLIPAFVAPVK